MNLKHINKTFVLQQDESDCGIACILSLIEYYGGENSLEHLRELSGTSKKGTTLLGLYQAAQYTGFIANGCEADITALLEHNHPVILHLTLDGKYQHYVVCYGYTNEKFIIGDPARGIILYTKEDLKEVWKSNACLTLSCSENFTLKKEIHTKKRQWLLNIAKEDYSILVVSTALGIIIAILGVITALFSQKLVDEIIPNKEFKHLWIGLSLVFILLTIRIGISAIRQFMLSTQSRDFNNRVIRLFYNRLLHLPHSFFDTRKIGDLVARLNDTRRIQQVISLMAGGIIIDTLVVVTTLILMFLYSYKIASILALSIPVFIYIICKNNRSIIIAQKDVMFGYAQSESNFINTMQGIDTIKSFNKELFFEVANKSIYESFQNKIFNLGKINIKISFISNFISVIITVCIMGLGSYFVLNNQLKLGELMALITLVGSIIPSIVNLSLISIPLNEAKVAFNRMFEFTNTSPEKHEGYDTEMSINSLIVQNLSFRFPGCIFR